MPTFLDLPLELRDKILSLVLSHHEPAPLDVSDASGRAQWDDSTSRSWNASYGVMYIEHPKGKDATSLLILNRQLHSETLNAIQCLPTKHSYVLDIIIAEERKVWPTWLSVPALTTRVDQVYAAIRTIGYLNPDNSRRSLFRGGCGGPPMITMSFFSLIERFVTVGPVGRRTRKGGDKRISLKELIIDVRTPDVPAEKILPKRHSAVFEARAYRREHGPDLLLNPEYILDYVTHDIQMIICMGYHTASYGAIIYERVGSIKVLMDGELHKEWNLAKCFGELEFHDSFGNYPREQRRDLFRNWKLKAYRTRIEFGLPVIPFEMEDDGKGKSASSE